jgi:hypothetical protein
MPAPKKVKRNPSSLDGLVTPIKMADRNPLESTKDEVPEPETTTSLPETADVPDAVLAAMIQSVITAELQKRSVVPQVSTAPAAAVLETREPLTAGRTSTPSLEESLVQRIAGLVEKALSGLALEKVQGEAPPEYTPPKTVGDCTVGASAEKASVPAARTSTATARAEPASVFRLRAPEQDRPSGGHTGRKRKREDSDAASSRSEKGLVRGSESMTGLRVLDPRKWVYLDEVGRAAMALNVEHFYDCLAQGPQPVAKENAAHARILQCVLRSVGTLQTPAEFDQFCVEIGELTIGRLQVMRTGVTASWAEADVYDRALFCPRNTPAFLQKAEQEVRRAHRKKGDNQKKESNRADPKDTKPDLTSTGRGRGRWSRDKKRGQRSANAY